MTKPLRIDHINFSVTQLDASIAWYTQTFAFQKVEEGEDGGRRWAILRSGDSMLCLSEQLRSAPGLRHFGLRLGDSKEWERKIEETGLSVQYGGAIDYPHSRSWYLKDPDGHEIEVTFWNNDEVRF